MRFSFLLFFLIIFLPFAAAAQNTAPQDAWAVRCEKGVKNRPGACEMYQRLVDVQTGMRVAEFAIGRHGGGEMARGVIVLPLGILLPPGVTLQIDEGEMFRFDVRYCTVDGCYAYVDLSDQLLDLMRSGGQAVFRFRTYGGEVIDMPMTLAGFTKAYDEIR